MPNPKLETYKNKATNTVYDLTDPNAQANLTAILDGTDIDSFGDVETALADYFPRSEQALLGAKNLLKNILTTTTATGITATVNSDKSATLSGLATTNTWFVLAGTWGSYVYPIKKGSYIFSAGTNLPNGVELHIMKGTTAEDYIATLNNAKSSVEFTLAQDTNVLIAIRVLNSTNLTTPITIYPMIRLASDPDDTYVPYVMTNKELTEKAKLRTVTPTIDGTIVKTYKGGLVAYNLLTRVCTFSMSLEIGTYANYANFVTGLPKSKSVYSFPCVCTNFSRNVGMEVLTTSANGGMYFTGLGQAANFADGDEINISGSYIIADDVVS